MNRRREPTVVVRVRQSSVMALDAEAVRLGLRSVDLWDAAVRSFMAMPPELREGVAKRPIAPARS